PVRPVAPAARVLQPDRPVPDARIFSIEELMTQSLPVRIEVFDDYPVLAVVRERPALAGSPQIDAFNRRSGWDSLRADLGFDDVRIPFVRSANHQDRVGERKSRGPQLVRPLYGVGVGDLVRIVRRPVRFKLGLRSFGAVERHDMEAV